MKGLSTAILISVFLWTVATSEIRNGFQKATTGRSRTTMTSDHPTKHDGEKEALGCEKTALDLVSNFSLCKAKTTVGLFLSCKDRCGVEPTWKESHERCSCDAKCIVHNDCCADFHRLCPDLLLEAKVKYSTLSESSPNCLYNQKVVSSCPNELVTPKSTTTFIPTTSPSNENRLKRFLTVLQPPVIDLSNGFVFIDIQVYNCYKSNLSKPIYLPWESPLTDNISVALEDIFLSHMKEDKLFYSGQDSYLARFPKSIPGVRGCYEGESVMCTGCLSSDRMVFSVNMLCESLATGRKVNYKRHMSTPVNYVFPSGKQQGSCRHFLDSPGSTFSDFNRYEKVSYIIQVNVMNNMESILVFKGTPWRRIKCANQIIPVGECEVIECSPGYLKSSTGKCFTPKYISIKVGKMNEEKQQEILPTPPCTCLMVYSIVKSLNIWKAGRINIISRCTIQITGTVVDLDLVDHDHITEVVESIIYASEKGVDLFKDVLSFDRAASKIGLVEKEHYLNYETEKNSTFSHRLNKTSSTAFEHNYTHNAKSYREIVESFPAKFFVKVQSGRDTCTDTYDIMFLCFMESETETEDASVCISQYKSQSSDSLTDGSMWNIAKINPLLVTVIVSAFN